MRANWFRDHGGGYIRLAADLRGAYSLGAWVLGARAAYTGSPSGQLPIFEAGTLGGFLNLSAYANSQFVADTVHYAHLRGERIIGRLPLGLRGDMRLGLALEGGRTGGTYTATERGSRLNSVAIYLGGETPFGPVYIGLGHSAAGSNNAYLFLGTALTRLRRRWRGGAPRPGRPGRRAAGRCAGWSRSSRPGIP